jgi:hypothetical protein
MGIVLEVGPKTTILLQNIIINLAVWYIDWVAVMKYKQQAVV